MAQKDAGCLLLIVWVLSAADVAEGTGLLAEDRVKPQRWKLLNHVSWKYPSTRDQISSAADYCTSKTSAREEFSSLGEVSKCKSVISSSFAEALFRCLK